MTTTNILLTGSCGNTVLSNVFIDYYMKDANDAQLKIYLYLLRVLGSRQTTGISEIAEQFNHTENDVIRSLKYWEARNLLSLSYDANQNIVGIALREIPAPGQSHMQSTPSVTVCSASEQNIQENHQKPAGGPMTNYVENASAGNEIPNHTTPNQGFRANEATNPKFTETMNHKATDDKTADNRIVTNEITDNITPNEENSTEDSHRISDASKNAPSFNPSISKFSMDYAKEKAAYTLEDLKRLKENSEACMLLVVAEQYFGRPLNPQEIRTLLFIYDRLAFCFDLEDYLLQFCLERDQKNIHYIESVAISWYESGITTVKKAREMARRYDKRYDKTAYTIMKYLGSTKEPTIFELDYIQKWTLLFHFPLSIIEEACKRTVMATEKHRFEYADSILKNWHEHSVSTKEDIQRLDREFEASKRRTADKRTVEKSHTQTTSAPKGNTGDFCNFTQNDYDFEALERALTAR